MLSLMQTKAIEWSIGKFLLTLGTLPVANMLTMILMNLDGTSQIFLAKIALLCLGIFVNETNMIIT